MCQYEDKIMAKDSEKSRYSAFTLVELLIVVSIIALLIGILLPALAAARDSAQKSNCLTNMRSMTQASIVYSVDNNGYATRFNEIRPTLPYEWRVNWFFTNKMDSYIGNQVEIARCPSTGREAPDPAIANNLTTDLGYFVGMHPEDVARWQFEGPKQSPSISVNVSASVAWYDKDGDSNFARLQLIDEGAQSLVMADLNYYIPSGTPRGYSNHGVGFAAQVTIEQWFDSIPGANRIYADGHGQWSGQDYVGVDDSVPSGPVDEESHFRHSAGRPYFW